MLIGKTLKKIDPTTLQIWKDLGQEAQKQAGQILVEQFANDPDRVNRFSLDFKEMHIDYSKNRIDASVMEGLLQLAAETKLQDGIAKMFAGHEINETEGRAVLHVALRAPRSANMNIEGHNIMHDVHAVLDQMESFVDRLNDGWKGFSGKKITDVVNIGIGGSDLGPVMVVEALKPYQEEGRKVHFVSNIDGSHIAQTLKDLDQETTLFIIASKTFTTIETMTNAHTARSWFLEKGEEARYPKTLCCCLDQYRCGRKVWY